MFLVVLAALCGLLFLVPAIQILSDLNAPIVDGSVISRKPVHLYNFFPRADFTILINGTDARIHAITGRYLLDEIPNKVRFHYSGDPAKEVFLFEYEENPCWILLFCWGISVVCAIILRVSRKSERFQKILDSK